MKKKIITILLLTIILTSFVQAMATTYGILVNTKKCYVTVYERIDGKWQPLKTVRCCVGKNGKTPKGTFKLRAKSPGFVHGDKLYRYASFYCGNCAFHAVPYYNGRYDNSSLGHKYSNGCIRLAAKDALWIYRHCKNGTKVIIN